MRFAFLSILAIITLAMATTQAKKNIIVSYPDETPDSVVEQAKQAIIDAGGLITHEYKLIKGFAAQSPAKVLESVQTMGQQYNAVIEEDQMVSIN
ncbi:hypothetical protein BJ878DRAFT_512133 [Calycina marina]|uniref:Uncharacterized protein n=1 Tax=Calycina marina TaxID=1763456 RepID=A0A9P7Z1G8_9HELO|nr:hypothetical protein BJ878DRAFT_512133 [Calycina marina]